MEHGGDALASSRPPVDAPPPVCSELATFGCAQYSSGSFVPYRGDFTNALTSDNTTFQFVPLTGKVR